MARVKPIRCSLSPGNAEAVKPSDGVKIVKNSKPNDGVKHENKRAKTQSQGDVKTEYTQKKSSECEPKDNGSAKRPEKSDIKEDNVALKGLQEKTASNAGDKREVNGEIADKKDVQPTQNNSAKSNGLDYTGDYFEIFGKAKALLAEVEQTVSGVYSRYFASKAEFKYSELQLISGIHEYLQALFMTESVKSGELSEMQLQFVYSLFIKADIFSGLTSLNQFMEKGKMVLEKTPMAFMCLVAVDRHKDQGLSSLFIKSVYGIYTLLNQLQPSKKLKTKKELLAGLISAMQAQGVLYND